METITTVITDKQNSIEVSKNAKGDIQYTIKFYFNREETAEIVDLMDKVKQDITDRFIKKE